MAEAKYTTYTYRLRAGNPMPISQPGAFVLHTFKAEYGLTEVYTCTTDLPPSSDFRGQGGDLLSASFSRLNVKGGNYFQGRKVFNYEYIEEDALPFNSLCN
jgi:hypothetical protein